MNTETQIRCPAPLCTVSRAQYRLGFVDGIYLTLQDKNSAENPNACWYAKSLTDDMERVIAELALIFPYLHQYNVVYRDSMGRWDGVLTHCGTFAGFKPMRAATFEDARACIEGRPYKPWKDENPPASALSAVAVLENLQA